MCAKLLCIPPDKKDTTDRKAPCSTYRLAVHTIMVNAATVPVPGVESVEINNDAIDAYALVTWGRVPPQPLPRAEESDYGLENMVAFR